MSKNFGKNIFKYALDVLHIPQQTFNLLNIARKKYKCNSFEGKFYSKYYDKIGESNTSKSGIICLCDGRLSHGGVTDRLRGILSTYSEAKRLNKNFYINWTDPFLLEDYLEPTEYDWRISKEEISHYKNEAFPIIIEETSQIQCHLNNFLRLRLSLCNAFPQTHVYSNADNARGHYSMLFKELFRPSIKLKQELDKHKEKLGNKYYAFSFRFVGLLGNFTDRQGIVLDNISAERLIRKVIAEFKNLADKLPSDVRILITSDSTVFLERIQNVDERIYIVPGDVKHIDLDDDLSEDVWMKLFVDQFLLMNSKRIVLMRTEQMYKSGFPRFAAEIGGVEFIDHQF